MKTVKSVLIVDDDAAGRAMLGLSLRQAGFSVKTAADGPEALRIIAEDGCDWLITDAKMWPMDGFELSRKAKSLRPGLHILMVSAVYSPGDFPGCPIEHFFSKPVDVERVVGWMGGNA